MSGIVDPSTPEREALNALLEYMIDDEQSYGGKLVAAYAAAVRARALADVAGWVEGMRVAEGGHLPECAKARQGARYCDCGAWGAREAHNAALDALLAKLREAK